jgi:hypothetical protein
MLEEPCLFREVNPRLPFRNLVAALVHPPPLEVKQRVTLFTIVSCTKSVWSYGVEGNIWGTVAPRTGRGKKNALRNFINLQPLLTWTGMAQSVQQLTTGRTVRWSNPGGGEVLLTRPDSTWGQFSFLYNEHRVFPGVKWQGRQSDHLRPGGQL